MKLQTGSSTGYQKDVQSMSIMNKASRGIPPPPQFWGYNRQEISFFHLFSFHLFSKLKMPGPAEEVYEEAVCILAFYNVDGRGETYHMLLYFCDFSFFLLLTLPSGRQRRGHDIGLCCVVDHSRFKKKTAGESMSIRDLKWNHRCKVALTISFKQQFLKVLDNIESYVYIRWNSIQFVFFIILNRYIISNRDLFQHLN